MTDNKKKKKAFVPNKKTDRKSSKSIQDKSPKKEDNFKKDEKYPRGAKYNKDDGYKSVYKKRRKRVTADEVEAKMPLNKYLAHAGICSRREAAEKVKEGLVEVNGKVETNPGYKVQDKDKIAYRGEDLQITKNRMYILLNKPKGYITTAKDDKNKRTVLDLVVDATTERVFPVGRLDRNTTGLLLLTNDGDLAHQLSHPTHEVEKIYHVVLDQELKQEDLEKIQKGIELDDGPVKVDEISYIDPNKKNEVGVEIHSGKNRIVHRIFDTLGYKVIALDRVIYAGLSKKLIPRGKYRILNAKEIVKLKHFNKYSD